MVEITSRRQDLPMVASVAHAAAAQTAVARLASLTVCLLFFLLQGCWDAARKEALEGKTACVKYVKASVVGQLASLINEHVRRHGGVLPDSWEDLRCCVDVEELSGPLAHPLELDFVFLDNPYRVRIEGNRRSIFLVEVRAEKRVGYQTPGRYVIWETETGDVRSSWLTEQQWRMVVSAQATGTTAELRTEEERQIPPITNNILRDPAQAVSAQ